jgi:transposase
MLNPKAINPRVWGQSPKQEASSAEDSVVTYAEAIGDEQLANWIGAHVRVFEFYQGVPKLVVPENTKTKLLASDNRY